MLKDYMGVPEKTYNIDFNVDELVKETAIISDKINQSLKILEVMQTTEDLTVETAKALMLPIYDYDKDFMEKDLLTYEGADYFDSSYKRSANIKSRDTNIDELIKKFFRIFYNLFQKLYEKIILWMEGIEPFIKKLETKIEKTDFSNKPEDFDESDNEKILSLIGVFSLFNGRLDNNIIGRIITSFKNMKDITNAVYGYKDFVDFVPTLFKDYNSMENFEDEKLSGSHEDGISKKFFEKLPKFYKDISGQLKSCIENGSVKVNSDLENHLVDGSIVAINDICILSTNGYDLNIIYTNKTSIISALKLKHTVGHIVSNKLIQDVSITPLDKDKINMLIKSIVSSDIKALSTNVRTSFKRLEGTMNEVMKKMDKVDFVKGETSWYNQLTRIAFSENLSILNTSLFNYITYNARLSSNCLKLIDMSLNKYPQTKEEEK